MATPTNAQLGKLLASYFSTSNDALAITFRKHYLPTTSPTPPRKPKAKRTTPRVTTATFTYRWLATAPQRIRERLEDPAFMASDMTAFAKQSKFKTLNAFVFDICKEELINGK